MQEGGVRVRIYEDYLLGVAVEDADVFAEEVALEGQALLPGEAVADESAVWVDILQDLPRYCLLQ